MQDNNYFKKLSELWSLLDERQGFCRDCADCKVHGICDNDGMPCDPQEYAITMIKRLKAGASPVPPAQAQEEIQGKAREIAQWVIDNRYPKSENEKISDFEMLHISMGKIMEGYTTGEGKVQ
ncbi:MAG: hypothetical protein QM791_04190 [Ferruginibacter sp.]